MHSYHILGVKLVEEPMIVKPMHYNKDNIIQYISENKNSDIKKDGCAQ